MKTGAKKQRASKRAKTRIALLSLIRWCALLGDTERKVGKIERDAMVWRCFYEIHLQKKNIAYVFYRPQFHVTRFLFERFYSYHIARELHFDILRARRPRRENEHGV